MEWCPNCQQNVNVDAVKQKNLNTSIQCCQCHLEIRMELPDLRELFKDINLKLDNKLKFKGELSDGETNL